MDDNLKKIINGSSFRIEEGSYVYAKVKSYPNDPKNHFMIASDKDEITVITRVENLDGLDLVERNKENYSLFEVRVAVPFYSVGFLAAISSAIAKANMNVLIVSTYSKDYFLVKHENMERVKNELINLGMSYE